MFWKKREEKAGEKDLFSNIPTCCDNCRLLEILKVLAPDEETRELFSPFWVNPNKQPEEEWENGKKCMDEGRTNEAFIHYLNTAILTLYFGSPKHEYWDKCKELQKRLMSPYLLDWYERALKSYDMIKDRQDILKIMRDACDEFHKRFRKKEG